MKNFYQNKKGFHKQTSFSIVWLPQSWLFPNSYVDEEKVETHWPVRIVWKSQTLHLSNFSMTKSYKTEIIRRTCLGFSHCLFCLFLYDKKIMNTNKFWAKLASLFRGSEILKLLWLEVFLCVSKWLSIKGNFNQLPKRWERWERVKR